MYAFLRALVCYSKEALAHWLSAPGVGVSSAVAREQRASPLAKSGQACRVKPIRRKLSQCRVWLASRWHTDGCACDQSLHDSGLSPGEYS